MAALAGGVTAVRAGPPGAHQTDSASSAVAALGAELRRLRIDRGLTLGQLGRLVRYSWQHLGAVERGTAVPSEVVVSACDAAVFGEWSFDLDVAGGDSGAGAGPASA
ncbi:MAG: helix-turn-helix domain-containing protein [Pseudonocardiaceae bacterium]